MKIMMIGGPRDGELEEFDKIPRGLSIPEWAPSSMNPSGGTFRQHVYRMEVIRAPNPARDIYALIHESIPKVTRLVAEQVERRERDANSLRVSRGPTQESICGLPLIALNLLPDRPPECNAFYQVGEVILAYSDHDREWVYIGRRSDFDEADMGLRRRASSFIYRASAIPGRFSPESGPTGIAAAFQFLHKFLSNPEDLGPAMDRAEEDGLMSKDDRP